MVFVDSSAYFDETECSQSLLQWLEKVRGIGTNKLATLVEGVREFDKLVVMAREEPAELRKLVGSVVAARIEQKLESEGHLPTKESRCSMPEVPDKTVLQMRFLVGKVQPFLAEFCKRNLYTMKVQKKRLNGVSLAYVLEDLGRNEDRKLAVVVRYSSRGYAVASALGELMMIADEWGFSGGLVIASRRGWRGQYVVDERIYPKNVKIIFLDE